MLIPELLKGVNDNQVV
uniref:Uncharacterized protein n=1 Tax=Arundo donax TaxID=35708 RepID=A0A0A9EXB1_ARUDO